MNVRSGTPRRFAARVLLPPVSSKAASMVLRSNARLASASGRTGPVSSEAAPGGPLSPRISSARALPPTPAKGAELVAFAELAVVGKPDVEEPGVDEPEVELDAPAPVPPSAIRSATRSAVITDPVA